MSKCLKALVLTLAVSTISAPGFATDLAATTDDNFKVYSTSGPFTIYADMKNKTCIAERFYENSIWALTAGSTDKSNLNYVGVFTANTTDKVVKKQKVKVDIDGQIFRTKATGATHRSQDSYLRGGFIEVDSRAFADALMVGRTMYVNPKKSKPFSLDISGLGDAVQEVTRCNRTF